MQEVKTQNTDKNNQIRVQKVVNGVKETMQEKINRMLVTEASRQAVY